MYTVLGNRLFNESYSIKIRTSNEKYDQVDGKRHGLYESWYMNVKLRIRCNYNDGKIHGLYERWYNDGQLYKKYMYINGKKHGFREYWHYNGQLRKRCNYINGKIHGSYKKLE